MLARPAALAATLLLGACASGGGARAPSANIWPSDSPTRVAGYVAPQPVDFEADGIEAQTPPMRRASSEPDDPSEPFSRNYGEEPAETETVDAASVGDAAQWSHPDDLPDDLPPAFRQKLANAAQ